MTLVDGAAHGAEAVVTVGQGVGHGEFPHPGGPGLLDNAYVGDIVAGQGVKANLQPLRIAGDTVGLENLPGQGPLPALLRRNGGLGPENPFRQKDAAVMECDHVKNLLSSGTEKRRDAAPPKWGHR